MGKEGLEPSRVLAHMVLSHARLPIPTLPRKQSSFYHHCTLLAIFAERAPRKTAFAPGSEASPQKVERLKRQSGHAAHGLDDEQEHQRDGIVGGV